VTRFIAAYLLTVFLVPLAVSAVVGCRSLPVGRECPRCRRATLLLRSRLLRLASRLPRLKFERRWCVHCAWEGVVRLRQPSLRLVLRTGAAPARGRSRDVRSLVVDGVIWWVRLETWRADDAWHGRLVFVEPGGRNLPDGRTLSGPSYQAILRKARSLPGGQLASRLRELVSG
jgi:hypothetical protein